MSEMKIIQNNYEKWFMDIEKKSTINIRINNKNEILDLYKFFLVCQRAKNEGKKGMYSLYITCPKDKDLFYKITAYLNLAKYYENIKDIRINNVSIINKYKNKIGEVNFFRRTPLLLINKSMYEFLSTRISEITAQYEEDNFFSDEMRRKVLEDDENTSRVLVKLCLNNLIGEVDKGTKVFSEQRRKYFQETEFYQMVKDMPFLACFIFSISMRAQNIDIIEKKKDEIRKERGIKQVRITESMFHELFPCEADIEADIFNAWDISDGILQLLENIVVHAGIKKEEGAVWDNGEGIFSMYLQTNDVGESEKEFNEESELYKEYTQYFRGYINEYKDGEYDEKFELGKSQRELLEKLQKGYYVDGKYIENYEKVRKIVQKRRGERKNIQYFLKIEIADYSGRNMCDVFRENLKLRAYPNRENFNDITVRSFFDPAKNIRKNGKNINEIEIWDTYYKGNNSIQHYGLQIFLSIISDNQGSFTVRSIGRNGALDVYSNTGEKNHKINVLPGTSYDILLPMNNFSKNREAQNTFLNADINYKFLKLDFLKPTKESKDIIKEFFELLNNIEINIQDKRSVIEGLKRKLEEIEDRERVLVFDYNKIEEDIQFEIFIKTLIWFSADLNNRNSYNNIAIINCNTNSFVRFIRYFFIYYDKNGNCEWMENKQFYLCGVDSAEEFIISGKNIQEMIGRVEKLAFSRRLNPNCLPMLTRMLQKRMGKWNESKNSSEEFYYTPFDLIIMNRKGETVFEQNVVKVLEQNIQQLESGCKIEPTHMRIGSKLHMHAFYEAELLFFNNYYVNRFAYLLAERIYKIGFDSNKPIWFIGYEAYSEMLICRLKQYMQEMKSEEKELKIYYSIYENSRGSVSNREENFRYFNADKIKELMDECAQVFLIVPINSTLTTFNKLHLAVNKKIEEIYRERDIEISAYLGIIQIRDFLKANEDLSDLEKTYWNEVNVKEKYIVSDKFLNSGNKKAYYLIVSHAIWEDPLECERCYPQDCLLEMPLIETDKTSVVPTQLIGLYDKGIKKEKKEKEKYRSYGTIESLKNYFYFDHVERGSNHFQIYMRTANYFIDNQKNVTEWLRGVVCKKIRAQKKGTTLAFDVLVNPLHFSNAAFVEAVNEEVFGGASYTLRIEVEKEFRDNVETKFSDLELLYENLSQMNIPAEINIHYVDDSINLGINYHRTKHLISSLFPQSAIQGEEKVKVNIFRNVIVLFNRMSYSSICDYVTDADNYFYYLDLRISTMRTHEDACYLCKEASNAEKIIRASATNEMGTYWEKQKEKYKKKSLQEAKKYKKELEKIDKKYYERYFRRIWCAHSLNSKLSELEEVVNNPLEVLKQVCQLIIKTKNDDDFVEYLMGYLYVYATPFISYRKSAREGVFSFIIILLERLIMNAEISEMLDRVQNSENRRSENKKEKEYIIQCIKIAEPVLIRMQNTKMNSKQKFELLKQLMKLSAELKSNYILRPDRIARIEDFAMEHSGSDGYIEFNIYYVALMKKILTLNADESKSTRFDKILNEHFEDIILADNKDAVVHLIKSMYVENTVGLRGVISNINSINEEVKFIPSYNDESYKNILKVNGVKEKQKEFLLDLKKLNSLFLVENAIEESNVKNVPFYETLCKYIAYLIDAHSVEFALKMENQSLMINKENKVVFGDVISYKTFASSSKGDNWEKSANELINIAESDRTKYVLGTFYVDEQNKTVVIRYEVVLDERNIKEVFLVLQFGDLTIAHIIQKIKFVLLFRNEICAKLFNDFNNNILHEWIEKNNMLEQLRKARANSHTDEENSYDDRSVWTLSERFLFGDEKEIKEHHEMHKDKMLGCVLGLMMNIRIGRTNVLLLSKGEFVEETLKKEQKFNYLRSDIEALKNIYFFDRLRIVDRNGKEVGSDIFPEEIYDAFMKKDDKEVYYDFRNYLVYFIFELFHSAVVNGVIEDSKVTVSVFKEEEYLFFKNKVKKTFSKESIERGLRREDAGISLATICEFFIYNYKERYVKLLMYEESFAIGIPIFK